MTIPQILEYTVWLLIFQREEFLSDFGGTIGLWVGASFLTAVEILDLMAQIIHFSYWKWKKRKTKRDKRTQRAEDGGTKFGQEVIGRMNENYNPAFTSLQQGHSAISTWPYNDTGPTLGLKHSGKSQNGYLSKGFS